MKHSFMTPSGKTIPLDGSEGFDLVMGVSGRLAPTFTVESDPAVGRQGNTFRRIRVPARDVDLPIDVFTADGDLRDKIRMLMADLNPRVGEAYFRVEHDDGEARYLSGRVASVEAVEDQGTSGTSFQRVMLVFRAFDPYWRGDEIIREYGVAAPNFFTDPDGFPLQLAGATIVAAVSEDNVGDADAWPVWTVRGPGVPRLENETSGQVLEFDTLTLAVGDELTVDTSPGVKTVEVNGSNVYDQLTLESSLFGLEPGVNMLNVDLEDGTEASLVRLRYRPRTLAP